MRTAGYILLLALAACGAACQPEHSLSLTERETTPAERNFETLWQASRSALKQAGFELDRQDRRAGVILTRATVGQHFFEWWRRDSATAFHWRENSIQTILRAACISIFPVEGTDRFDVRVEVLSARTDRRPLQLTDASQGAELHSGDRFGRERPWRGHETTPLTRILKFEDLRRKTPPVEGVVPLGRDGDLEMILEQEIRHRAGLGPPETSEAPDDLPPPPVP
jgi:hypothetical protein